MEGDWQHNAGPPPGWYPDPGAWGWVRWWDGVRWSAAAQPAMAAPPPVHPVTGLPYAEFLPRLGAAVIDGLILAVPTYLLLGLLFVPLLLSLDPATGLPTSGFFVGMLVGVPLAIVGTWVVQGAYFVWFESRRGATPGKAMLGLRVVDVDTGGMLPTRRALGRFLGRLVSATALYIGYLVMLSDPHRQTWHDQWSRAVVVRTR